MNDLMKAYRDAIDVTGPAVRERILARAAEDENLTLEQVVALAEYAFQ